MKKNIIFDEINVNDEDYKEDYKDWLSINNMDESEFSLHEYVVEDIGMWYQEEMDNLDGIYVDGVIVAFGDIRGWRGIRHGVGIVGKKVVNILTKYTEAYNTFYCDRYNVHQDAIHHDGRNHILFRVAKDLKFAKHLMERMSNGDLDYKSFMKATKSLRPYVAKVYGW